MTVTEARSGAAVRGSDGANRVSVLGVGPTAEFDKLLRYRSGERNDNRRVHGE
jgi:hypothetical protein